MKHLISSIFAIITLTACQSTANSPKQVAEQYWQALQKGDTETARKLVSQDTQQSLENFLALPATERNSFNTVSLGTEQSSVATIIGTPDADTNNQQQFNTVLIMENGSWKINASHTLEAAADVIINKPDQEDSLQQKLDSMDKALEEGTDILNEFMQEGSKEMSESLLKGMNKMNESLRDAIEKMKRRREQQNHPEQPADDIQEKNGEGLL